MGSCGHTKLQLQENQCEKKKKGATHLRLATNTPIFEWCVTKLVIMKGRQKNKYNYDEIGNFGLNICQSLD